MFATPRAVPAGALLHLYKRDIKSDIYRSDSGVGCSKSWGGHGLPGLPALSSGIWCAAGRLWVLFYGRQRQIAQSDSQNRTVLPIFARSSKKLPVLKEDLLRCFARIRRIGAVFCKNLQKRFTVNSTACRVFCIFLQKSELRGVDGFRVSAYSSHLCC